MVGRFSRRRVRVVHSPGSDWLARPETMRLALEALARSIISEGDSGDVVRQGVILALLTPGAVL